MHLVLIPTYNECENIVPLVNALNAIPNLHVLVIDDASPDGTAHHVREHAQFQKTCFLLEREGKQGIGSAYRAGIAWAMEKNMCRTVTQMDADFSHDPQDITRMLLASGEGYDLVVGSRKIAGGKIVGWNVWRKACSALAMIASRIALRLNTKDVTAGFRTWNIHTLVKMSLDGIRSDGYAFQEEMLFRAEQTGARIKEVPVTFVDRVRGKSKLGFTDVWGFFTMLVLLSCERHKKFLIYAGVGTLGAAVDMFIFLALYSYEHMHVLAANGVATACAVLHNFLWHHRVTFSTHTRSFHDALVIFFLVSLAGMALNSLIVYILIFMLVPAIVAKAAAIVVVMLWNYMLNSRITFKI